MGRRSKHNADFKKKIALEALREQKTINQIAKENNLHPAQISDWKRQLLDGCASIFESKVNPSSPSKREDEIAILERKIGRLSIENDFLKKNSENDSACKKTANRIGASALIRADAVRANRSLQKLVLLCSCRGASRGFSIDATYGQRVSNTNHNK